MDLAFALTLTLNFQGQIKRDGTPIPFNLTLKNELVIHDYDHELLVTRVGCKDM